MKKLISPRSLFGAAATLAAIFSFERSTPAAVNLTTFTDPHPVVNGGTIGFAYAGNKFVGSVQNDGLGVLYSTDLTGGNVQVFAPTVNIPNAGSPSSEHFVASSLGLGGFPSRDIYVASGPNIIHIDNAGSAGGSFLTTPLSSPVRGILFDAVGSFGGDMLVTTSAGDVYRVNNLGVPTKIANTGEDTEGLDIAPLGAGFGSFDGQLIVASEGSGQIRAIKPDGTVSPITTVASAEELTFVPLNLGASGNPVEGFYGANYTPNVQKAAASEFVGMLGDVIVTGETTHLINRIHWNGSAFEVTQIGQFPNQPEDGIFVTAAIINPGPTPTPDQAPGLLLIGSFVGLLLYVRGRKTVKA